jgi:hypothetical protein
LMMRYGPCLSLLNYCLPDKDDIQPMKWQRSDKVNLR